MNNTIDINKIYGLKAGLYETMHQQMFAESELFRDQLAKYDIPEYEPSKRTYAPVASYNIEPTVQPDEEYEYEEEIQEVNENDIAESDMAV